jgi:hypothetical protein
VAHTGSDAATGEERRCFVEPNELLHGGLEILGVGRGEVGHQTGDVNFGHVGKTSREGRQLLHGDAEPSHAGVDLDVHGHGFFAAAGELGEALELPHVVDDRSEAPSQKLAVRRGVVAPHHQDRSNDSGLAQLHGLFEQGDAESIGAGALQRAGYRRSAVAITVRFEHGPDPGAMRVPLHGAKVVTKSLEVDFGPGRADGIGRGRAARAQHA